MNIEQTSFFMSVHESSFRDDKNCLWLGGTECSCNTHGLKSFRQEGFDQLSCANYISVSGEELYLYNLEMSAVAKYRISPRKHWSVMGGKAGQKGDTKRGLKDDLERKKREGGMGDGISSGSKITIADINSLINLLSSSVLLPLLTFSTPGPLCPPSATNFTALSGCLALNSGTDCPSSLLSRLTPAHLTHTHFHPRPLPLLSCPLSLKVQCCQWGGGSPIDIYTAS